MLSVLGWINGLTVFFLFMLTIIFGFIFFFQSIKHEVKLLSYLGACIIFVGLFFLGSFLDFLLILYTGNNLDCRLIFLLNWMGYPFLALTSLYVGVELSVPEKKWKILPICIILGILFGVVFLMNLQGTYYCISPQQPGEDLIDVNLNFVSLLFTLVFILFVLIVIFVGFGTLYKSIKSEGLIKKKLFLISLGNLSFDVLMFIDTLVIFPYVFLTRIGVIFTFWCWYYGLREEPEERIQVEKAVKVEGNLFRLSRTRPINISEEEIELYRNKFICLVCKGSALDYTYICRNCKALYCFKCANALSNTENACWACESPFDKSKPIKQLEPEQEEKLEEIEEIHHHKKQIVQKDEEIRK